MVRPDDPAVDGQTALCRVFEGAEDEGVGFVEAQVNGVGHGASACWKRSGTAY